MMDLRFLLKAGNVVMTKENMFYFVTNKTIVTTDGHLNICQYDSKLLFITDYSKHHKFDIIKVYHVNYNRLEKQIINSICSREFECLKSEITTDFLEQIKELIQSNDIRVSLIYPKLLMASIF